MKIVVLASGSKGNATYVEMGNYKIIIDLGVSCAYVENQLKAINVNPKEVSHILITHNHSDHIKGLKTFIKKYNPIVTLTKGMQADLELNNYDKILYYQPNIMLDNIKLTIFRTSHDVDDSFAFVIDYNKKSLVYITDTGYLNLRYFEHLKNKNVYIIESNHDIELLQSGKYPQHLKQRILSDRGHLSNYDCARYLTKLVGKNTKHIILAHLSEENNHPDLAYKAVEHLTNQHNIDVQVALPDQITSIIEV